MQRSAGSAVPARSMPCSVLPALPNAFKKCLVLFLGLPQKPAPVQNRHSISMGKELGRAVRGGCFPGQYFSPF